MFQFGTTINNFSFPDVAVQAFEACKTHLLVASETAQSIARHAASKVHTSVSLFFLHAPKVASAKFEELKSMAQTGIANFVTSQVVPARNIYSAAELLDLHTRATTSQFSAIEHVGIKIEEVNFQTSDHSTLNGVELREQVEGAPPCNKYIVYFMPNSALWEECLEQLKTIQQKSGASVLCYNYRGVGRSTGVLRSEEPLTSDGVEIVNSLIARGIHPLLHGYSLGGGVAMQVAARLAQAGIVLNVCIERSFTSLPNVLLAQSRLLGHIAFPILYWTGWMLDSEAALNHLRGKIIVIFHSQDPLILFAAQFSRALDKRGLQLQGVDTIEMSQEQGIVDAHNRSWFHEEKERYGQLTKAIL